MDVNDFLEHAGVKGMKWGVRRAEKKAAREAVTKEARSKGYSKAARSQDVREIGNRATRRVEARINRGESIKTARQKEYAKSIAKGVASAVAIMAAPVAIRAISRGASSYASGVNAKRGAAEAAKILADSRGLTSYNTLALSFDSVSGIWR